LESHHDSKTEIWLIYYKKESGKPSIGYDGSVEEAICYGWIDGTIKRIDDERYTRKFTPRRKKSNWSQPNIKRARKVIAEKLMTPAGLGKIPEEVMKAIRNGSAGKVAPKELPTPPELREVLDSNPPALKNWESWAPSHRKMYIHWMADAKRPETRERRMKRIVKMAEANERQLM